MLIESIVRKTLELKDHRVVRVEQTADGLRIELARKWCRHLPCSKCAGRTRVRDQLRERTWRHVPLRGIAVLLVYAPWRVECPRCGGHVEAVVP